MAAKSHSIDGRVIEPKCAIAREESGQPGTHVTEKLLVELKKIPKNISLEITARTMEKLMSFEIINDRQCGKKGGIGSLERKEALGLLLFFLAVLCSTWDPSSGIEPTSPTLKGQSLNHLTTREVLGLLLLITMIMWIKLYCSNTIPSVVRSKKGFI